MHHGEKSGVVLEWNDGYAAKQYHTKTPTHCASNPRREAPGLFSFVPTARFVSAVLANGRSESLQWCNCFVRLGRAEGL